MKNTLHPDMPDMTTSTSKLNKSTHMQKAGSTTKSRKQAAQILCLHLRAVSTTRELCRLLLHNLASEGKVVCYTHD